MSASPKPTEGFAPYNPETGKIYVDKIASRREDVARLSHCIIIAVLITPVPKPAS